MTVRVSVRDSIKRVGHERLLHGSGKRSTSVVFKSEEYLGFILKVF
ncbi:hypothetical protein [Neobacillus terrae]|nr:hypothetical protein [Neobacillus terrae]NHM32034.1 hypothetical protein [Neobacillus terrae]